MSLLRVIPVTVEDCDLFPELSTCHKSFEMIKLVQARGGVVYVYISLYCILIFRTICPLP